MFVTDEPPFLVKTGELQEEAVKWLYYNLPESGWVSCHMEFRKAGPVAESMARLTLSDGTVEPVAPPAKMIDALLDLRDYMAQLGKGAWLSMTLDLTKAGKYDFHYNYNERPTWMIEVADEAYVEDLKKYPRPPEALPDWYPRGD